MKDNQIPVKDTLELNTNELIDMLTYSFSSFIKTNSIEKHPSVFLHGQPGVGKSQAIYEIARRIMQETNIHTHVIDIRLLLFNPVDLRGIPIADRESRTSIWLKPDIFNLVDNEKTIYFLFLDELTAAPTSIQASAYQIALDRKIGEHQLPKNTFVIAAGNRDNDYALSYEMPTALRNRFMHIELKTDINSWLYWAKKHNIHERITSFLDEHPDKFITKDLSTQNPIIITPRTWEMLSKMLCHIDESNPQFFSLISSIVGKDIAHLMVENVKGFNVKKLINGEVGDAPQSLEEIQSAVIAVESILDECFDNEKAVSSILKYIKLLPIDYAVRVFRKVLKYEPTTYSISKLDAYHELINSLEQMHEQ